MRLRQLWLRDAAAAGHSEEAVGEEAEAGAEADEGAAAKAAAVEAATVAAATVAAAGSQRASQAAAGPVAARSHQAEVEDWTGVAARASWEVAPAMGAAETLRWGEAAAAMDSVAARLARIPIQLMKGCSARGAGRTTPQCQCCWPEKMVV